MFPIITPQSVNLNPNFALVFSRLQILVCFLELLQLEDFGIDHRTQFVQVGLDGPAHVLQLKPAASPDSPDRDEVQPGIKKRRHVQPLRRSAGNAGRYDGAVKPDAG